VSFPKNTLWREYTPGSLHFPIQRASWPRDNQDWTLHLGLSLFPPNLPVGFWRTYERQTSPDPSGHRL
jgi:hypothetical protein